MYTWYVNVTGDVQVYKGDVNESEFCDFTPQMAELATTNIEEFNKKFHFWNEVGMGKKYIKPCKYFIPNQYKEAFFMCISEPVGFPTSCGVTNVNVSDFLD